MSNNSSDDKNVTVKQSFLERVLLARVGKSEPIEQPVRNPDRISKPNSECKALEKRIESLEKKDTILELLDEPRKT